MRTFQFFLFVIIDMNLSNLFLFIFSFAGLYSDEVGLTLGAVEAVVLGPRVASRLHGGGTRIYHVAPLRLGRRRRLRFDRR